MRSLKTEAKGGQKRSLLRGRCIGVYPGQYYDQETGLHYNYFRYYNPQTGRYITPDPIGLEGGINLFTYVQNNPINLVDPEGLLGIEQIVKWLVNKAIVKVFGKLIENKPGCTMGELEMMVDSDGDGINDYYDLDADWDGDGIPNYYDPDDDNDGIEDISDTENNNDPPTGKRKQPCS